MDKLVLLLAHGFGFGKAPKAPGTFGTIPGLLLFWICLIPGSVAGYFLVATSFIFASVFVCGRAEKILKLQDPGSIVFDEMIAIPFALSSWALLAASDRFPSITYFFSDGRWITLVLFLGLFRFFDIVKPWPVKQSQDAPGGWGVTIDDVLAAIYTTFAGFLLLRFIPALPR
ncbi:MAG: phosphatidylglycerophosphatase A [Verrucomicrobiales bacterium]